MHHDLKPYAITCKTIQLPCCRSPVCSTALASAHKEWSAAQGEMTQRLSQLEEVLRDHGSQHFAEMAGAGGGMTAEGMDPHQEDDSMVVINELVGVLATGEGLQNRGAAPLCV